jgi:hypothetical protein
VRRSASGALRLIADVALPGCDPVYGTTGPLIERWRVTD